MTEELKKVIEPTAYAAKPTDTVHAIVIHSAIQHDAVLDVLEERKYQDSLFGQACDRDHMTEGTWLKLLDDYARGRLDHTKHYDFRKRMVKACAIALAALEQIDGKASRTPQLKDSDGTSQSEKEVG